MPPTLIVSADHREDVQSRRPPKEWRLWREGHLPILPRDDPRLIQLAIQ